MVDNNSLSINVKTKMTNFQVLNSDFTRCKCNVFYTGRNRNYSDITNEALQRLIKRKGYSNVPVVGHIKQSKKTGKKIMGSHDRKIEITNDGIEEINECTAMGVIPVDANPRMETIIDSHGVKRDYFTVDIILWTHYFPDIIETSYGDDIYFNQSMEIKTLDICADGSYTVINDFSLQALCMLGKYDNNCCNGCLDDNSEPCFEDSVIKRFSINESKFKKNFELMLQTLKRYDKGENDNSDMKGEVRMDKSKIIAKLSEYTYQNVLGETVAKYVLVDITDTSIGVIDREDNKLYSFSCAEIENEILIDDDSKKECAFTFKDCDNVNEKCFDYSAEVAMIADNVRKVTAEATETSLAKSFSEEYTAKINEIAGKFADLTTEFDKVSAELEKYKKAEQEQLETEKRNQIDNLLNEYSKKIGKMSEFLIYRARKDLYEKNVEDIQRDLTIMAGKAMMTKDKGQGVDYNPTVSAVAFSLGNSKVNKYAQEEDRYGDLFAKVMNK